MPYIKQERRPALDEVAENAVYALEDSAQNGFVGGDLNYLLSKVVWTLFEKSKGYSTAAELIATLENVKLEFYRRKVAPYEDEKIEENGDV